MSPTVERHPFFIRQSCKESEIPPGSTVDNITLGHWDSCSPAHIDHGFWACLLSLGAATGMKGLTSLRKRFFLKLCY